MLSEYLKELRQRRNDWNAEVMKSYQARYLTFQTKTCPKDSFIPACVLADYGFYFDEIFKKVKCFECHYTYELANGAHVDEDQHTLQELLIDHIRANKSCSQATKSMSDYLKEAFDSSANIDVDASFADIELLNSNKNVYIDFHARLTTFDNVRMLLNKQELVANGFYRSISKAKQINNVLLNALENEKATSKETIIEYLAKRLTSLIHLKCAFCPYECLVFENSALNTMYKSPFDEHKAKFAHVCSILQRQNEQKHVHHNADLSWLQSLYEMTSNVEQKLDNMILKVNQHFTEVKQLPDVVKCLIDYDKYQHLNQKQHLLNCDDGLVSEKIIYVPNLNSSDQSNATANKTTNDFEKLKNVLNMSNTVINEEAFHKEFTHYQRRLDSFKEWPPSLPQQPVDLARAGFYYYGIKDMVKCFFCNGGLKNWDRNDDPFEDHVRWFPKCQYIRQLMGSEYVDKVKDKYKNQDSGFNNQTKQAQYSSFSFNETTSIRPNKTLMKAKRSASPRSVNSRLDLNIIRKISEITAISRDVLKQTIENKLSNELGDDFFASSVELALAAYELNEANKEKSDDSNKHISDFVITNLPVKLNVNILNEFFFIRYGIRAKHIRILKEENSEESCMAFVCLKSEDLSFVEEIYQDLNQKLFPIKFSEQSESVSSIIKTDWEELKEKLKEFMKQSQSNESNFGQIETNRAHLQTHKEHQVKDDQTNANQNMLTVKKYSKQDSEEKNESYCIICLDNKKNIVFLPCAHFVSCMECGLSMKNCPVCRTKIQATVRTFS